MSSKEPRLPDYLGHIVEAIARIEGYISDMPKEVFIANQLLIDAVVRNIDEASNRVTKNHREFRDAHPEVESRELRNAQRHRARLFQG